MVRPSSRHLALVLALALWACASAAKPKTGRDWSKLTDKDWEKIEDEWETDEEREEYSFKPPQQKGLDMEKLQREMKKAKKKGKGQSPKVQQMVQESQQSSGPAMMFATVDYDGCCEKNKTEKMATEWAAMLKTSGMDISTYVIEADQVLFTSQAGLHAHEIRDYVLQQPEVVAVEWNSNRVPGPAETEEWKARDAKKKAEKEATKKAKDEEDAAVKKAEAALKKKKKKRRKTKSEGGGKDEV